MNLVEKLFVVLFLEFLLFEGWVGDGVGVCCWCLIEWVGCLDV